MKTLEDFEYREDIQILKRFTRIMGVGPTLAKKWVLKGYKTPEDLLQDQEELRLTETQRLGIIYEKVSIN